MSYWTPSGSTIQITGTAQNFMPNSGSIALITNRSSADASIRFRSSAGIGGNFIDISASSQIYLPISDAAPLVYGINPLDVYIQPGNSPQINKQTIVASLGTLEAIINANNLGFYIIDPLYTYQDTSMTIPIATVDESIGAVLDLSGNGNHLLQLEASMRPLFKASNGKYWAEFDGVNDSIGFFDSSYLLPTMRTMGVRIISDAQIESIYAGARGDNYSSAIVTNGSGTGISMASVNINSTQILTNAGTNLVITDYWDGPLSKFTINGTDFTEFPLAIRDDFPLGFYVGSRGGVFAFSNIAFSGGGLASYDIGDKLSQVREFISNRQ